MCFIVEIVAQNYKTTFIAYPVATVLNKLLKKPSFRRFFKDAHIFTIDGNGFPVQCVTFALINTLRYARLSVFIKTILESNVSPSPYVLKWSNLIIQCNGCCLFCFTSLGPIKISNYKVIINVTLTNVSAHVISFEHRQGLTHPNLKIPLSA